MQSTGRRGSRRRSVRAVAFSRVRLGLVIFLVLLVIEYLVVPQLVGASKHFDILARINVAWLVAGILLETASVLCYAMLTRTLLPHGGPRLSVLFRITLTTTAVTHVIPAGAAGGAGLGFRLLTQNGVQPADAAFVLASEAIGSAVVLNALLWIALVLSIPLAGVHTIYVVIALIGLVAGFAVATLLYTFTRGEERAVRVVRSLGRRIPRVGADRLERVVRQFGDSIGHLARHPELLRRGVTWAALNWLFDAASLWAFLAALGHPVDPLLLFAAYGIANVLAAIPLSPAGLGIIEATAASLLVSFGVPRSVATFGVLGWRLVNFWLPIPLGGLAYISLRLPAGLRRPLRRQAQAEE